jgi:hypothetical protein
MRRHREHVIVMVVLATAMASRQAVAETAAAEAAPAPAGEAKPAAAQPTPAAAAQPTPKVAAAAPRAGQNALWSEGFMAIPSVGINSLLGDAGETSGVGLRVGLLAGSRMAELFSLNVGFAFDKVTVNAPNASDYVFDVGFNPLLHFPQEKLEIVAGPVAGVFLDKAAGGSGALSFDSWSYGWTIGANAGLLFRVSSKVRLGGLLNFFVRNPLQTCVTANGMDNCVSDGINSLKMLSLSAAVML